MEVDEQLQFKSHETRLERIYISDNLRIETLEPYFNERTVLDFSGDYPYKSELLWLWQLSNILEVRRGKEDSMRSIQLDHSIRIDSMQKVQILTRKRGSPIDKLVAELMILANQHWGKFLAEHATPCIYRVQNESKVKMSLIPDIHQGLGVEFYAWFTSPLRRAIDFYNQSQLLSLIHHNPREKYPKDDLQIIYQAFDFSYQAYLAFQDQLEIYWSYVWLIQEAKKECMAQIIKDEWVRFEEIPIKRKIIGLKQTIPGQKVNIKILDIDLIEPRLECTS
jgi:exoribonuclease-2